MTEYVRPDIEVIELGDENILMASCDPVCSRECGVFTCEAECAENCTGVCPEF